MEHRMNAKHAVMITGFLVATAPAVAKPPLQLAGPGVRVEPLAIAPARIENGKFVLGEWQEYAAKTPRGAKGVYYTWDMCEAYLGRTGEYPNYANGGLGAAKGDSRWPGENLSSCGLGSSRWFFGYSYVNPLTVEDVTANGCFDQGGNAVDSIDLAWWWGGGPCVAMLFTSDDSAECDDGDPMNHSYYSGVALNFGTVPFGGYHFADADGINSDFGIFVRNPAPGGSFLVALTHDGSTLATLPGTQLMLWGDDIGWRPGQSSEFSWDDDNPISGSFSSNECYSYEYGVCPSDLQKTVALGTLRCPADVNNDGFVNGDDYDDFCWAFDRSDWRCADLNGDGFANGDDFDAFASWFDEGC
jgi:hypothetical protein